MQINEVVDIEDQFINSLGIFTLRLDGILTYEPTKNNKPMDMTGFEKSLNYLVILGKNKPRPYLFDATNLFNFSTEEQQFMKNNISKIATKCAILTKNNTVKLAFNMFLFLFRPPILIKGFSCKHKAIEWLLTE